MKSFLSRAAILTAGLAIKITAQSSFDLVEPGCVDVLRKGASYAQVVGKACREFVDSSLRISVSIEEDNCVLTGAKYWNLPYVSPEYVDAEHQRAFVFALSEVDIANYICAPSESGDEVILGETSTECKRDDATETTEFFRESFHIPLRCKYEDTFDESSMVDQPVSETSEREITDESMVVQEESADPETDFVSGSEQDNSILEEENDFQEGILESRVAQGGLPTTGLDPATTRNFHLHVPKTGGSSLRVHAKLLFGELLGDETSGNKAFCNTAGGMWDDDNGAIWDEETARRECLLVTGEHEYSDIPQRVFTTMREPKSHVLSLYFHCLESQESRAGRERQGRTEAFVPSLDEWLERWVNVKRGTRYAPIEYKCFDPINMQNKFFGKPNDRQGLLDRFEVVGITSSLTQSVCVEIITLTGRVPRSCDCTGFKDGETGRRRAMLRRRLQGLEDVRLDHGVTHHGDTFEPTPEQDAMLEELTDIDRLLYDEAKLIFAQQVKDVEEKYGIELC